MSKKPTSAQDEGDPRLSAYKYEGVTSPSALGSQNLSSAQQRTAWKNENNAYGTPAPYSKQTRGSYYNFDDSSSTTREDK
jgi:hypothetical protein